MTRETKVGLIVAGSFLCLVGIVVASKMGRGGDPGDQPPRIAAVVPDKDAKKPLEPAKKEPGPVSVPKKDETKRPDELLIEQIQKDALSGSPPGLAIAAPKGDALPIPKGPAGMVPPPLPPSGFVLEADPRKKELAPVAAPPGLIDLTPIPVAVAPPADPRKKPATDNVPPAEPGKGIGGIGAVEPAPLPSLKKDVVAPAPVLVGGVAVPLPIDVKKQPDNPPFRR